jgi:hypothetical protein
VSERQVGIDTATEVVVDGIRDMYDAYVAGDRARFDSHLAVETTTWESHLPRLYDRAELDGYRDGRTPAETPPLIELRVEVQRAEIWGDVALVGYLLVAVPVEGDSEVARVTDVLRRFDAEWRIVHHHAEHRAGIESEVLA